MARTPRTAALSWHGGAAMAKTPGNAQAAAPQARRCQGRWKRHSPIYLAYPSHSAARRGGWTDGWRHGQPGGACSCRPAARHPRPAWDHGRCGRVGRPTGQRAWVAPLRQPSGSKPYAARAADGACLAPFMVDFAGRRASHAIDRAGSRVAHQLGAWSLSRQPTWWKVRLAPAAWHSYGTHRGL